MNRKNVLLFLIVSFIIVLIFVIPTSSMAKDPIYKEPNIKDSGTDKDGLDDMITDAEKFEQGNGAEVGESSSTIFELNQGKLQSFSSSLFSVLIIAATAVTVVVGVVLGIKYMIGSVEEKAEYKKLLLPYIAGCVAIYGALGIWKMLVKILGSI